MRRQMQFPPATCIAHLNFTRGLNHDEQRSRNQHVREMMGDQAAAKLGDSADSKTFGAPIAAYAIDHVFADIWTRPGLDRRSRSLVTMSVMIAMRQPHEFAIHMGAGLNNGLTLKEIEEVLIQALPYVGYPAIATALAAAAEVIKERGLDVDENYTGHRGLL